MKLSELYSTFTLGGSMEESVRTLLGQTHWFTVNNNFDPKTGDALPQALSAFLTRVARPKPGGKLHDRLWRITEHARPSVERLFRALNESPRRQQALLPVHAVQELDVGSFVKLSKRPGRTIREKLAGKPYLHAVRRFQSVNLPENRLLKAFVTHLAELLELRHDLLGEEEDDLLQTIKSWLRSEEAQAIARWDNLAPNNTLLSHRNYRRVWDSWRWLQMLDDDIAHDFSQLENRTETMRIWNKYGEMYSNGTHLFADMPILFDYEAFAIRPWVSKLATKKTPQRIDRSSSTKTIYEPVCVDLTSLHPHFATTREVSLSLRDNYFWQEWKNDDEADDIELFNSDAVYLHVDAISIASKDLFYPKENSLELLDRAARAFVARLRNTFKNDTLIWLVPDFLNDFELEIIRRNLNARFSNAEPLPRCVAAAFEQIEYSLLSDGFPIIVVDSIGGRTCVTKLIARFDSELKERLPETKGFYLKRCPPVIISHVDTESSAETVSQYYDIITVDCKGQWHDAIRPKKPDYIEIESLKSDPRIGQFAFCINLSGSPVSGGIRFDTLQKRAGDIPLWRDNIPELSIKVMKEGSYQRFYLVSRGTTIKPIRGFAVRILVDEYFTLPAGRSFYQFPLFQGENEEEIGYSARIYSPAFPLKTDTVCKLDLTFEYGADEPYKLVFEPLDKSFPPVRANWRRTEEVIITDAPAPKYPEPKNWADLRRVPKPDGDGVSDLLEWVWSAILTLDRRLFIHPQIRLVGRINSHWKPNEYRKDFAFAECNEVNGSVYINEKEFLEGLHHTNYTVGDEVSFNLKGRQDRYFGRRIAQPEYKEEARLQNFDEDAIDDLKGLIRKSLYFPFILIWKDGRSITDEDCPKDFAEAVKGKIAYLTGLLNQTGIPQRAWIELQFLLACLHKDTTNECIQWITKQIEDGSIDDPQAIGYALGDVSEEWQKNVFHSLTSKPNTAAIRVFSYAIWREQHFIKKFSVSQLQATLKVLLKRLADVDNWDKDAREQLELLLGLLRTRASTNQEINMLLQPHQSITKELAKQVERLTEIVVRSNIDLFSRVQLNIQKPAGDRTPDLLYALRLYLTGDDGANAIYITGVSDDDEE